MGELPGAGENPGVGDVSGVGEVMGVGEAAAYGKGEPPGVGEALEVIAPFGVGDDPWVPAGRLDPGDAEILPAAFVGAGVEINSSNGSDAGHNEVTRAT